jgi:single-strand DNA-binding protein
MAGSLNSVTLIGFVGKDPEIRHMSNGKMVAGFSLATSERWKDKTSGEMQEKTEWHRCVAFDRQAETISEYVQKGSYLHVTGKLATRKWQDKDGSDRYTTEINAQSIIFLDRKSDDRPSERPAAQPADRPAPQRPKPASASGGFDNMDDSIPFANPYRGRFSYVI